MKCSVCDSDNVDVLGDHCICRDCGNEFYLFDRFGYIDGDGDGDSWNGGEDGYGDNDHDSDDNDLW